MERALAWGLWWMREAVASVFGRPELGDDRLPARLYFWLWNASDMAQGYSHGPNDPDRREEAEWTNEWLYTDEEPF